MGQRVISVSPVELEASKERGASLALRVSAPVGAAAPLPVILFAHGFGSSMDGYAPLANYWAAHGFVVIQPTFLDSRTYALPSDDPRTASIWRFRVDDVKRILDQLDIVEGSLPNLRLDRERIAAVGHSFGAQTTGLLLGARYDEDMSDARIRAGVLLSAGGRGGDDLSPMAREHFPYLDQKYATLTTPTLVVAGDKDVSPLTVRGPDWFTDAFHLSPGADGLVTLFGGEHMLGGISGVRVTETSDENPERVAAVQRLTTAYLRTALNLDHDAWPAAVREWKERGISQGRIDEK